MKNNTSPKAIQRSEYKQPSYWLDTVELRFDLGEQVTRVRSMLALRRNQSLQTAVHSLFLDGEDLRLISIIKDGEKLDHSQYTLLDNGLQLHGLADTCVLEIETEIEPQNNTRLEGLYKSSGNFCTQCEAQGFRRITYFPDRPDVMASFSVKIVADKEKYPVLLSNGNLIKHGDAGDGRHWVRWEDPFPKPSYLFALVAGDLACVSDSFVTHSGRVVDLKIYVEQHNKDKCDWAMASLKKSMRWDEERFGLEYDLDVYMIVAVDDFNMGAMENKGLNIFNSKFVLAARDTATDMDFQGVESVIAHEYFHNWTGNRVTCRDWFQLSLKEGLTVFRDQQFSADMNSAAVKRIEDVRSLRARQFPEDAGPMAHPIRPDSYIEINNFYTATVYEKGAEVIRMMYSLLGEKHFRAAMDLYFERHDGQAVTCEDFVQAMEDASGCDLQQFRYWYSQSGTPKLEVSSAYDADAQSFTLQFKQNPRVGELQRDNHMMHIPVSVALLDTDGRNLPLQLQGKSDAEELTEELLLDITQQQQSFVFTGIKTPPLPSLLRGFSAPVALSYPYTEQQLAFLMAHETDRFNQWEAAQRLAIQTVQKVMQQQVAALPECAFADALQPLLVQSDDDAALRAEALMLPSVDAIGEQQSQIDVQQIHAARMQLKTALATRYQQEFIALYGFCQSAAANAMDARAMELRRLKNVCLDYLATLQQELWLPIAQAQYQHAANMTDSLAALKHLTNTDGDVRNQALDSFYQRWHQQRLVIDKWFSIQAMSSREQVLQDIQSLTEHKDFSLTNPNRVRSVVAVFSMANPEHFHAEDGSGYELLADFICKIDPNNPQLAARLVAPLTRWKRYAVQYQAPMQQQLQRIAKLDGLSNDVFEMVSKGLSQ